MSRDARSSTHYFVLLIILAVCGIAAPAHAASINLGVVSFVTAPSDGTANQVSFEIDNFTGTLSLPPDFPVITELVFTNLQFTYTIGGVSSVVALPDLGPGYAYAFRVPDTTTIVSASLAGTLSTTDLLLDGGVPFEATSSSFLVQLQPSNGSYLVPDADVAVITAESVPEPAALFLVLSGAALILLRRR